jgi:hypothetical protein
MIRAASLALLVALPLPAAAEAPLDRLLKDLRRAGFAEVTVTATLLGRMRIVAEGGDGVREIVLNPRTGEVLRDLWLSRGNDDRDQDGDDNDDDDDDGDDGGQGRGRGRGRGGDDE